MSHLALRFRLYPFPLACLVELRLDLIFLTLHHRQHLSQGLLVLEGD